MAPTGAPHMGVSVEEAVCVGVDVCEEVDVGVPVPDCDDDGVPVIEEVLVEEPVCEGEGEGVPVGEPVVLGEGVPVSVPVVEALPDELLVALVVALLEGEPVPVLVCEGVDGGVREGEEDALRRDAMLRPRKVMAERAASASPASHSVDSETPLEKALLGMSCVMLPSRKQPPRAAATCAPMISKEEEIAASSLAAKEYPAQLGTPQQAIRQAFSDETETVPLRVPTRSIRGRARKREGGQERPGVRVEVGERVGERVADGDDVAVAEVEEDAVDDSDGRVQRHTMAKVL